MSKVKIAINGFGRIGRATLRVMLSNPHISVMAINDLSDPITLAHLFKYDSVHGKFNGTVTGNKEGIVVNGTAIPFFSESNVSQLPWKKYDIDIVVESTGRNTKENQAQEHIKAGAKKVIISAPSSDNLKTVCIGINEGILTSKDVIISNASCTTNNVAPLVKVLDENWGIKSGYITTIHSYTGDQSLHDKPHKDLRRARAAAHNIIPTTTGAAKAITSIFPHLEGQLGGAGIRVPVINGSLTDFTCFMPKETTVEEINFAFEKASKNELKGVLEYTSEPIVSQDIMGSPYSCVYDSLLTSVVGNMVKVVGWYDNETGYANRLCDLALHLKKINQF